MSLIRRPIRFDDAAVLTDMYVAVRRPFYDGRMTPTEVTNLLRLDAEFHEHWVTHAHPTAAWEAIVLDGEVVGRLITDESAERLALVDIYIAPEHQRRGIGSLVLGAVVQQAKGRRIEARICRGSFAEAWYVGFGFEPAEVNLFEVSLVRASTLP